MVRERHARQTNMQAQARRCGAHRSDFAHSTRSVLIVRRFRWQFAAIIRLLLLFNTLHRLMQTLSGRIICVRVWANGNVILKLFSTNSASHRQSIACKTHIFILYIEAALLTHYSWLNRAGSISPSCAIDNRLTQIFSLFCLHGATTMHNLILN